MSASKLRDRVGALPDKEKWDFASGPLRPNGALSSCRQALGRFLLDLGGSSRGTAFDTWQRYPTKLNDLRVPFASRRHDLGLGGFQLVTLAAALRYGPCASSTSMCRDVRYPLNIRLYFFNGASRVSNSSHVLPYRVAPNFIRDVLQLLGNLV